MTVRDELHAKAIAEGFKDEVCPKCGTLFEAHIHFVHCADQPCPMVSKKDQRTVLEKLAEWHAFGEDAREKPK